MKSFSFHKIIRVGKLKNIELNKKIATEAHVFLGRLWNFASVGSAVFGFCLFTVMLKVLTRFAVHSTFAIMIRVFNSYHESNEWVDRMSFFIFDTFKIALVKAEAMLSFK